MHADKTALYWAEGRRAPNARNGRFGLPLSTLRSDRQQSEMYLGYIQTGKLERSEGTYSSLNCICGIYTDRYSGAV
jgi:hypothetical protein